MDGLELAIYPAGGRRPVFARLGGPPDSLHARVAVEGRGGQRLQGAFVPLGPLQRLPHELLDRRIVVLVFAEDFAEGQPNDPPRRRDSGIVVQHPVRDAEIEGLAAEGI